MKVEYYMDAKTMPRLRGGQERDMTHSDENRLCKAPILSALQKRADRGAFGFHTPGHQGGKGLWPPFQDMLRQLGPRMDLTELPGLDNLASASGCIAESENQMASAAGSAKTFYLVNGSTVGLQAALLASNHPGGRVLMPAHAHMSLFNGLILTGGRLAMLPVTVDPVWGIPLGVSRQVFNNDSQLAGEVLVTVNPTYHGVMADLDAQKHWISKHPDAAWLVDEAHGPHLPYLDHPAGGSALSFGADMVVQSTHKMAGTLTQTSLLHCGKEKWQLPLQQSLNILQTSSPSYLLLGSLDAFQAHMREDGRERLQEARQLAVSLAEEIRSMGGYRLWQDELQAGWRTDPCKITLGAGDLGLTGFELGRLLREVYHIDTELAARSHVLLLITMGHRSKDIEGLVSALKEIRNRAPLEPKPLQPKGGWTTQPEGWTEAEYTPRQVFFSPKRTIPLKDAAGRIAAAAVVPYPPGIPLWVPGMVIGQEAVERLETWLAEGESCVGLLQGPEGACVAVCDGPLA